MSRPTTIKDMVRARDAALLSMDAEKIIAYFREYSPDHGDEFAEMYRHKTRLFWAAVHKARYNATSLQREEREKSRRWLEARGFAKEIFG